MAGSGEEGRVVVDLRSAAESAAAADDEEAHAAAPLHEIESLCMRCGDNGTTRLLLTVIPHFRGVVLMAFECPHCAERNNEIQFAGQLQPKGCCCRLEVPSGQSELRVDGVLMRLRDTRVYCSFGNNEEAKPPWYCVNAAGGKQHSLACLWYALNQKGYPSDSAAYADPNLIDQKLPVVMQKTEKLKIPN